MLRSKVTDRSQTTLPNGVRKALGLRPGEDSIEWEIRGAEAVVRRVVLLVVLLVVVLRLFLLRRGRPGMHLSLVPRHGRRPHRRNV